jgi:iron complex transport system permease protein
MQGLLTPKKLIIRTGLGLTVLIMVMMACASVGTTRRISYQAVLEGPGEHATSNTDYQILVNIRLPRVLLACLVGAALACAGVVFQALLRNPLADPYILGISSGAGLGAMIAVVAGLNWTLWGRSPIAVFAFVGASATVWLVWFIGRLTGKFHVTGLLLAGVVVNAFFSAVIMFITSIAQADKVYAIIFWLMGNMTAEDFLTLWIGAGFVLGGIVALFFMAPQLNALSLGPENALSMGVNVRRTRAIAFGVAAAITAVAVSLSGLIGFVGLVVPHAVRLVFGPDHRQLLPLSAIVGAIFLAATDTLARVIIAPSQLPVGVVTAIAGGPVFLVLLVKYSRQVGWMK